MWRSSLLPTPCVEAINPRVALHGTAWRPAPSCLRGSQEANLSGDALLQQIQSDAGPLNARYVGRSSRVRWATVELTAQAPSASIAAHNYFRIFRPACIPWLGLMICWYSVMIRNLLSIDLHLCFRIRTDGDT